MINTFPRGILWAVPVALMENPLGYPSGAYALFSPDGCESFVFSCAFENGKPHHVTLQYDVEKSAVEHLIGTRFVALVTELRLGDRAQAFRIELPADIRPLWKGDTTPHLTVSYKQFPVHGGEAALNGKVTARPLLKAEFAINFHEFQIEE